MNEDVEAQEAPSFLPDQPSNITIAKPQSYETKKVNKKDLDDFIERFKKKNEEANKNLADVLDTRLRKSEALIKKLTLEQEEKNRQEEQEKKVAELQPEVEEAIEKLPFKNEPSSPVNKETIANELYPDDPDKIDEVEEVKKNHSILPKPLPEDWDFRQTGNKGRM